MSNELHALLSKELSRLQDLDLLSSKSTTKFSGVKKILAELLNIPEAVIYVSTIDKAANTNARMQQMQIRQEVPWKIFVGVCTKDDVTSSNTYLSQTTRNLSMPNCPHLEGSLWLSNQEGVDFPNWSPARASFTANSELGQTIKSLWPRVMFDTISAVAREESKSESNKSRNSLNPISAIKHLDLKPITKALLDDPHQVILAGPPGTGKSFTAKAIAAALLGTPENLENPNISFVQFHPTFEYEDFIEGFRPVPSGEGFFELQLTPGILMRLVNDMRENPEEPRVLIIDEMNRANLSKVLGEILFLLEYREVEITLKSQSSMSLPKNLYIISTMNTADRNIRSIDLALRRRFRYFELAPSTDALRNFFDSDKNTNEIGEDLFTGFEELNRDLSNQLDRHHMIGHTFFMVGYLSESAIQDIWQYQIFPIIEEYFFDRSDIAQEFSLAKYFPKSAS
jgi:hypothetical protein